MLILNDDTMSDFVLSDAQLLGVSWESDGRDVCLTLRTADDRVALLTCLWACDVSIDLRYAHPVLRGGKQLYEAGYALSWEARFQRSNGMWRMLFEFPPQGSIELLCNEARLEYAQSNPYKAPVRQV